MERVAFLNEKGNVAVSVRNEVRAQAKEFIGEVLTDVLDERVVENADGGFSIAVAETEAGDTIYAKLDLTITLKDPSEKRKTYTKTKAPTEGPDVPNLFE